jgi:hypothetical protein
MKADNPRNKIHHEPAIRKDVPPNKNVMWRAKGGEASHFVLNIGMGQRQANKMVGDHKALPPGLMDFAMLPIWHQAESFSELCTDPSASRASVNLGEDPRTVSAVNACDADLNSGAILDQLVNRLTKCDLGPSGFFIIGHHDCGPSSA